MAVETLDDLFLHALSDIYSAEKQLTKALPKMARASTNPKLAAGFTEHLTETEGQVARIDQIVALLSIKLKRIKCAAMEGLVEEGAEAIEEIVKGPVRDAGLINAAQKVEHYEIASYGTLCALGRQLGYDKQVIALLTDTLAEEKATDEKLTILAEGEANADAGNAQPRSAASDATSRAQDKPSSTSKSKSSAGADDEASQQSGNDTSAESDPQSDASPKRSTARKTTGGGSTSTAKTASKKSTAKTDSGSSGKKPAAKKAAKAG